MKQLMGDRWRDKTAAFSFSPFSSTASTLASFPNSSWTTTVRPLRAATCRGLQRGRDSDKTLYTLTRAHSCTMGGWEVLTSAEPH